MIDREVKAILLEGQDKARAIVSERRSDMEKLAEVLLEKETLERTDLERYFGKEVTPDDKLEIDGHEVIRR